MAAEGPLHDLGVIPITPSDAQGMGRAGETVRRTLGMAAVMKRWLVLLASTTTSGCCGTWPS
jgi:urease subunit alpha